MGWILWMLPLSLIPSTALASVRLGFGADYWFNRGGEFNITLAPMASLTKGLSVGGRFGALVATEPAVAGVPVDLVLRISVERVYLEGSAGPWFLFADNPVHAHVAFGFGLQTRVVSFGLEAGWLDPHPLLGFRLGLRL